MSIMLFIPLILITAVVEHPRRRHTRRPGGYRKQTGHEFHSGRSY